MKKLILTIVFVLMSLNVFTKDLDQDLTTARIITQAKDFNKIKGMSKRQAFISTLVPIIEDIKESIEKDRKRVEIIYEKDKNLLSDEEKEFLEQKFIAYKVKNKNIQDLLVKMILPPTSLIIAQASLESGWGSSRIAKEGNNLFGMKSSLKDPNRAVKVGKKEYYKKYETIGDSVADYVMTISRHNAYASLRSGINNGEGTLALVNYLSNYSELKGVYAKRLTQVVKSNNLEKHD